MDIDSSEVGVCYRLGLAAIQLKDYELALIAFQEVIFRAIETVQRDYHYNSNSSSSLRTD